MTLDFVVISLEDSSLRSVLTARLTMLGMNVVTREHWTARNDARDSGFTSAVLVTDNEALGLQEALERPWLQVLILNGVTNDAGERPLRLPKRGATQRIADALIRLSAINPA